VQDRYTVCAKYTIGLGIVLNVAQVEACFDLFGDSAKYEAR
jgi:hypothetical protein